MTRRRAGVALWMGAQVVLGPVPALAHSHVSAREARSEARREAAQLTRFEAALAAQPSATRALEGWCGQLTGAEHEAITARLVAGHDAVLPADVRSLLGVGRGEALGYRHVRLACSLGTLSEAHNWYVPGRLTPAMNAALASTDTPFGKVVAPLHFAREPLASLRGRGDGCPSRTVLTHRALLRLPDGGPLALVVECYSVLNLASPRPVEMPPRGKPLPPAP